MTAIEMAIRFMGSEHDRLLRSRDQMHVIKRDAIKECRIADALEAEYTAGRLDAQLTGVDMGLRQLIMVRDRQQEETS